jgi:hypothetical protein
MTCKPIFAVDPGNIESGYCIYYPDTHRVGEVGVIENSQLINAIKLARTWEYDFAFEMIASYGMAVGKDVFNTCVWIGRFVQTAKPCTTDLVYRQDVKMHLCKTTKAKDANISQAIKDLFPKTGGGKNPVVGTKKQPGPLYGVKSHIWPALGVALTYAHQKK